MSAPSIEGAGLRPVTEFAAGELGPAIRDLAADNRRQLTRERYLPGVVKRWGGLDDAEAATRLERVQLAWSDEFRSFAVTEDPSSDRVDLVVGMATLQEWPGVRLNSLTRPLPPRLAERLPRALGRLVMDSGADERFWRLVTPVNISAWVDTDAAAADPDCLVEAYYEIADEALLIPPEKRLDEKAALDLDAIPREEDEIMDGVGLDRAVWTIEPVRSVGAREAITEAVLWRGGDVKGAITRRFDDQEASGLAVPPESVLYVFGPRRDPSS